MVEVRADPRTIDAAWMTAALEEAGIANGSKVADVAFEGFVGTGQMSRNARLRLTWDGDPEGRPTSFVGKFPSDDEAARTGARGRGRRWDGRVRASGDTLRAGWLLGCGRSRDGPGLWRLGCNRRCDGHGRRG